MDAAVRLIARKGVKAATIRSIAHEAGVTEGAVYRHYDSKEQLYLDAYTRLITEMAGAKQEIAARSAGVREKLRDWVRVSYEFYDQHADAFTFVLLIPHDLPASQREITRAQGTLFMDVVRRAQEQQQMKPMRPEIALSHFTGVMLNVPRLINEGTLQGPAVQYLPDVVQAVYRVLEIEP